MQSRPFTRLSTILLVIMIVGAVLVTILAGRLLSEIYWMKVTNTAPPPQGYQMVLLGPAKLAADILVDHRLYFELNQTIFDSMGAGYCRIWASSQTNAAAVYRQLEEVLERYVAAVNDAVRGNTSRDAVSFLVLHFLVSYYYAVRSDLEHQNLQYVQDAAMHGCILGQALERMDEVVARLMSTYGEPEVDVLVYARQMIGTARSLGLLPSSWDYSVNASVPATASLVRAEMALIGYLFEDCGPVLNVTQGSLAQARNMSEAFILRVARDPYLLLLFYTPLLGDPRVGPVVGPDITGWYRGVQYGSGGFMGAYALYQKVEGHYEPGYLLLKFRDTCGSQGPFAGALGLEDAAYLHFYAWMKVQGLDSLAIGGGG